MKIFINEKVLKRLRSDVDIEIFPLCINVEISHDLLDVHPDELLNHTGFFNCGFESRPAKARQMMRDGVVHLVNISGHDIEWKNEASRSFSKRVLNWLGDLRSSRRMNNDVMQFNAIVYFANVPFNNFEILAIKQYDRTIKIKPGEVFSFMNHFSILEVG